MRYREMLTVAVALNRQDNRALHVQLADQISVAIDAGTLAADTRMPSTRTLASLFGVSRGVTTAAYDLLTARGYLHARSGSGTYVLGHEEPSTLPRDDDDEFIDMRPGLSSAEALPLKAWRAAWRHASHQPVVHVPRLGLTALREAVSTYLRQARGLVLPDHRVVITRGLVSGVVLVVDALRAKRVALDPPVPPALHAVLRTLNSEFTYDTVVASPDGHPVTGEVMSFRRRRQLAVWPGNLLELLPDNEIRPVRLPRLVALAPRTCVVGDLTDLLAMPLGYVLVPTQLVDRIGAVDQPSAITQLAATHLLADGVRLMRRLCQLRGRKRAILQTVFPGPLVPVDSAARVAETLLGRGVRVETLDAYHGTTEQALLLGYAHLPDETLRKALSVLTEVLPRVPGERGRPVDPATGDGQRVGRAG